LINPSSPERGFRYFNRGGIAGFDGIHFPHGNWQNRIYKELGGLQLPFVECRLFVYLFFHFAGRFSIIAVMPSWKSSVRSKMLL